MTDHGPSSSRPAMTDNEKIERIRSWHIKFSNNLYNKLGKNKPELTSVLKHHLIIENIIDEILRTIIKNPKDILKLRSNNKIDLVHALNIQFGESIIIEQLRTVQKLRNHFAHKLDYKIKNIDLIAFTKNERMPQKTNLEKFVLGAHRLEGYLVGVLSIAKFSPFLFDYIRNIDLYKKKDKKILKIISKKNRRKWIEALENLKIRI